MIWHGRIDTLGVNIFENKIPYVQYMLLSDITPKIIRFGNVAKKSSFVLRHGQIVKPFESRKIEAISSPIQVVFVIAMIYMYDRIIGQVFGETDPTLLSAAAVAC